MRFIQSAIILAGAILVFLCCSCGSGARRHAPNTDAAEEILCGGYTEFRALTETELEMFDRLVSQIEGSRLDAEQVATQVVNGTNYRFLASSAQDELVMVTIYEPLPGNGEPRITGVEKIEQ